MPLTPLTISQIFNVTFKVIKQGWKVFLPWIILLSFLSALPAWIIHPPKNLPSTLDGMWDWLDAAFYSRSFLAYLVLGTFVYPYASLVIIRLASDLYLRGAANSEVAMNTAREHFLPLLLTFLQLMFRIFFPWLAVSVLLTPIIPFLPGGFFSVTIWVTVGIVFFLTFTLWLYWLTTFVILVQVVALEGKRGKEAFRRCRQLMRTYGERSLLRNNIARISYLFLYIFGLMIVGAILGVLIGSSRSELVSGFIQAFTHLLSLIAVTIFYYDIRLRGEPNEFTTNQPERI